MTAKCEIAPRFSRRRMLPDALAMALALAAFCPVLAQDAVELTPPIEMLFITDHGPAPAVDAAAHLSPPLEPGDYVWTPGRASTGEVVVVISLPQQRAHVYRGGIRIGVSTISSGKPGYATPTGAFPILQKRRVHRSNLYDNAPMPYMQRLTWGGIALHAGPLPGYPASHGCIRLPEGFASALFAVTQRGEIVVVADYSSHGPDVVSPGERAPVDPSSGLELRRSDQDREQPLTQQPAA